MPVTIIYSNRKGRHIDGRWGSWLIEIATGPSMRDLQGKLMTLAVLLDEDQQDTQGLCVIASEKVTHERIQDELKSMRRVLRPELAMRLHVGRCDPFGENVLLDSGLPYGLSEAVSQVARKEASSRRRAPGGTQNDVFAHLMRSWLAGQGPLMVKDIKEAVGASHPTVTAVLDRLKKQGVLSRLSDRRVALENFPRDEWTGWVLSNKESRTSAKFVDPAKQARSPYEMAARLSRVTKQNVAISGVVGAQHYYPDLNITSAPRFDVCIALKPGKKDDLSFVRMLDAGLVRDDEAMYPALVVHTLLPGAHKRFVEVNGQLFADRLECLIDLYEMKLYEQADEMLDHFIRQRPEPKG